MIPAGDFKVAALGFAVAAAYGPGMLSPGYAIRWAAIAIGLPLVARLDPRDIPESIRWVLVFVLICAAIPTFTVSPDPWGGSLELFYILLLCLCMFAGAGMVRTAPLMAGIGLGLIPSAVLSITQRFDIWSPLPQFTSVSGLFYNSEIMAEFSAIVLVWALVAAWRDPRWLWMAVSAGIPVAMSQGRIAMIMVAAGLAAALPVRMRIGTLAVLVLLGVGAIWAMGPGNLDSVEHRITLWVATILSWNQYGHGLGWFMDRYPYEQFAHSDVLQAVAEIGLGAFVLIAIPVMALRSKRGTHADRAAFVAVLVGCALSHPLHFPASGFVAAVLAGFLVGRGAGLCMVRNHRGPLDDGGEERADAAGLRDPEGFPGGRGPVPVRSLHPAAASPQYGTTRPHPGGA